MKKVIHASSLALVESRRNQVNIDPPIPNRGNRSQGVSDFLKTPHSIRCDGHFQTPFRYMCYHPAVDLSVRWLSQIQIIYLYLGDTVEAKWRSVKLCANDEQKVESVMRLRC